MNALKFIAINNNNNNFSISIITEYSMATQEQGIFQLTFVKKPSNKRPKTSSLNSSTHYHLGIDKNYSQNDPMLKIKLLKMQAKQAQDQYISMLTNVKQSEKSINQNYREIQRKKVNFLKLYQTKKLKNLTYNLLSQCKTERLQHQSQIKDQVKKQKIQQEIKRLITKQQKQSILEKIKKSFQSEKEELSCKQYLKKKELFNASRNSFLAIKREHQQSRQRKTQIRSYGSVRAKHNYWKRVGEEIQIMEEYQKILKDLEQFENFDNIVQPRAQTSHTARTQKTGFFITEKK